MTTYRTQADTPALPASPSEAPPPPLPARTWRQAWREFWCGHPAAGYPRLRADWFLWHSEHREVVRVGKGDRGFVRIHVVRRCRACGQVELTCLRQPPHEGRYEPVEALL